MTNPPYMLEHLEAIAEILRSPKVFSFLHVPVQAGSNKVLDSMRREYTVEEFRRIVDFLVANVPEVTIATDIICGFPNETEADFELTMELMAQYRLAVVNISQFYPRPGTPAAKMRRIDTQVVKNRSRRLTKLFEEFAPYVHLPGQTLRVYFNTEVSDDGLHSVGHTKSYVKVLVPLDATLPGQTKMVYIQSCQRFHVVGVLALNQSPQVKQESESKSEPTPFNIRSQDSSPLTSTSSALIVAVGAAALALAAVVVLRRKK
jgi:threonylcarbamoyladenosine tRNA methylthiotransferase CDKAL1